MIPTFLGRLTCCTFCSYMYVCMYVCAYSVVVSIFDFHRSDRDSNPGRGGEIFTMITTTLYCGIIGKCSPKPLGRWKLFGSPSMAELARCQKSSLVQLLITLIYTLILRN